MPKKNLCPAGHDLDKVGTYASQGHSLQRRCKACHREKRIQRYEPREKVSRLDQIPAAPVHKVMKDWARENTVGSHNMALAQELDLSFKRVSLIFDAETISFDLADRIITTLDVFAWHKKDSELNEIYFSVPLGVIDGKPKGEPRAVPLPHSQDWLARQTGFSRVTISRVLGGHKGAASEENTKKILKAATQAGMI